MSDQPNPATGAWTAKSVFTLYGHPNNPDGWQAIADSHNAALDVEVEHSVKLANDYITLKQQLAAEHKQYEELAVASVEQGKQLAAERENAEKAAARAELAQIALAAEREITEVWGKRLEACSLDNDKLRSQLDMMVEALKQIVSYNYIDTVGRNRRVAKAALGKIELPPRNPWKLK